MRSTAPNKVLPKATQEVVDREVAIAKEKAVAAGKPANILDKIAEGAANTFLKENTLMTQPFVKDGSKNVGHSRLINHLYFYWAFVQG